MAPMLVAGTRKSNRQGINGIPNGSRNSFFSTSPGGAVKRLDAAKF